MFHIYTISSSDFTEWNISTVRMWYFTCLNKLTLIDTGFDGMQCKYNKVPVLIVEGNSQPCHILSFLGSSFLDIYEFLDFLGTSLFCILIVMLDFLGTSIFYILIITLDFLGTSFFDILFIFLDFPHTLLFDILFFWIFMVSAFFIHQLRFRIFLILCFLICNIWLSIFHIFSFSYCFMESFLFVISLLNCLSFLDHHDIFFI